MSALSAARLLSERNIVVTNAEWHGGEGISTLNANVNLVERRFSLIQVRQENTVPKPVTASLAAAERAERIFTISLTVRKIFAR